MVQLEIPANKLRWIERRYGSAPKEALEELYREHGTWAAVADELGICRNSLTSWRHILGITEGAEPSKSNIKFASRIRQLEALHGVSIDQVLDNTRRDLGSWNAVALRLGLGLSTVRKLRSEPVPDGISEVGETNE